MKKITLVVFCVTMLVFSSHAQSTTAPMENKTAKGAAITETEVKDYLTHYWTKDCHDFEECTVKFDTPVRIADKERHSFHNGITVAECYPVKVDFTISTRNKKMNYPANVIHHTGGVLYFFRNSFGEWEMQSENTNIKFD
jgi:hypothetical protein